MNLELIENGKEPNQQLIDSYNIIKTENRKQSNQGISIVDARQLESFKDWEEEKLNELVTTIKSFCLISFTIWNESKKQQNSNLAA